MLLRLIETHLTWRLLEGCLYELYDAVAGEVDTSDQNQAANAIFGAVKEMKSFLDGLQKL